MTSFCGVRCLGVGIFGGSVKRDPFLETREWRVLLTLLLCLQCAFSKCLGVDITVGTYPQGDINIEYPGNPLEIYCTAENYTSRDLEFTVGGRRLPSKIVNDTTIKLFIEQPGIQRAVYYCTNKASRKNCVNKVLVDTPPRDVRDFKCISQNLDSLNCSWTSPKTLTNIEYSLTFFVNEKLVKECNTQREFDTWYCMWNTSTVPRYRQQLSEYVFNLISYNNFGRNEQNITVDHFAVVKPDRPINLTVLAEKPHSVILQWSIPNNIVDFLSCGIDHRIEYQIARIDNLTTFHAVNALSLPSKNKTYRFELSPLPYSHRQYEVRVYIKSKLASEEYWSDFSYVVFRTASELPPRAPAMPTGAFETSVYTPYRFVRIYWQQLEEFEESGANFTYKVIATQDNKAQTLFPDKNKSLSYVEIPRASLNALDISVKSWNMLGSSENTSYLYIPPERQILGGPSLFSKFAYENGTYELSWEAEIKNIDNYTLFWCQHNWTNVCVGRMNYTVLTPNKKAHIINLPRDTQYQFAISMNRGTQTSGMVWATCEISRDGAVMHAFSASLSHGVPSKSFVELTWRMNCKLRDGIITGYNITYCPIIETSNNCDLEVGSQSVYISNPRAMSVNITNLLPCRTYNFYFGLNTTYGPKTINNATTSVTTPEDTPTNPVNIAISDISFNSMIISWDPPIKKNGNIKKYIIYNNSVPFDTYTLDAPTLTDVSRKYFNLTNLHGYTNYTWNIQACNSLCSALKESDALFVRTTIGPPSKMEAPKVQYNPDVLKWHKPNITNGFLDRYQIRKVKDDSHSHVQIYNTTELYQEFTYCDGDHDIVTYQVRAINFDELPSHGAMAYSSNVTLPKWDENDLKAEYPGEWSDHSIIYCRTNNTLEITLKCMALLALAIGMVYVSIKLYKKYRKMEDIIPKLPTGLEVIEKENSKYPFTSWSPAGKDDKTVSSDEALLLPNSNPVPSPEIKQKDDICGNSDHTDSTALSDSSRGPVERDVSTSDASSDSSLRLDVDAVKNDDKSESQDHDEETSTEPETSPEPSPYFGDKILRKPVVNPTNGYVTAPISQPVAHSSYVMASLNPPGFTAVVPQAPPPAPRPQVSSTGYVRAEDAQSKSFMHFPVVGSSPTKQFGPESLPVMRNLPPAQNQAADSVGSYIQLQSLEGVPSKPALRDCAVKPAPAVASGYVSHGDAVIHKHLSILSGGQLADEPVILDPAMSPDAYCRFSWSKDPTKDNLNTLLGNTTLNSTNN